MICDLGSHWWEVEASPDDVVLKQSLGLDHRKAMIPASGPEEANGPFGYLWMYIISYR